MGWLNSKGWSGSAGGWEAMVAAATTNANNQVLYSQDFTNSNWGKLQTGTGVTPVVTGNYAVAPDSTTTASRIQLDLGATPATALSRIYQGIYVGPNKNTLNSIYLKTNDASTHTIYLNEGENGFVAVSVTGTWTRFNLTRRVNIDSPQMQFGLAGASAGLVPTDNVVDLLAWGAQIDIVTIETTPRTYVATTSAPVGP